MMVPGSNILNLALTVIAKQSIVYFRFLSRSQNNVGQDVTIYDAPTTVQGSFQPVPRRLYQIYGLDLQKSYFTFYASKNILDVGRDVSGDQIVFQGFRYQCESSNDWFGEDGWVGVLCVLIKEQNEDQPVFGFNEVPLINNNRNFTDGNYSNLGET
jgi:hypothetical protein